MKVQKGKLPSTGKTVWLVLDKDYKSIKPIQQYISYLANINRASGTLRTYARNLMLYWQYLDKYLLDWKEITLEELADFIHWLRLPNYDPNIISIEQQQSKRRESTINNILTTVCCFYDFHERLGTTESVDTTTEKSFKARNFKSFLHHINKSKPVRARLLKVKEPKVFPGCLKPEEVKKIVEACNNLRDKFLICLLYETGIRIGEALGLRHEDIVTDGKHNEIKIVPRANNHEDANVKSNAERIVGVTPKLTKLYADYLIHDYPDEIDCDYVFVNIYSSSVEIGTPMTYNGVSSLFNRISTSTEIEVTPHLLRHTHATELIRSGWDMAYVQKRLGHADIQTTVNTYVHLIEKDLREEFDKYIESRKNYAR